MEKRHNNLDRWRLTRLRQLLVQHFDLEELQTLCFDVQVDFEELAGGTKSAKVRELVAYLQRENRLDALLGAAASARPSVQWPSRIQIELPCPYQGLFAFGEEDAAFFFGREAFTARLVSVIQQQPLLAIIGPSGSGKSSVVFAGLIPKLRLIETWHIVSLRPGERPFYALATALLPSLEPQMSETDRLVETRKLAQALAQNDLPLADVIKRVIQKAKTARLLLVIDQFEELYTLCPTIETRHLFLDHLLATVDTSHDGLPFALVLTLRADFLAQVLGYRPFADALQENRDEKLGPMNRVELQQAIEEPAKSLGIQFESGLINRILDDVGEEPGNLPLLEFALTLLWEHQENGRLLHSVYDAIGQVGGALAGFADEVYAQASSAEQAEIRRIFTQLVQPGAGTEDTRRIAIKADIGDIRWRLVQQLANSRLIVTSQDEDERETAEIAHEALIQRWVRLQEWMNADRNFRAWQERLRLVIHQWEATAHDIDTLLRGTPLAEAESWLAERQADLSQVEQEFIQNSIDLREQVAAEKAAQQKRELEAAQRLAEAERQRHQEQSRANVQLRRRAVFATIVSVFAIAAAVTAVYFVIQANHDSRIAQARELAARSLETLDRDPIASLTLAIDAVNMTYTVDETYASEAEVALYRALMESPFRAVLPANWVWFSPDGTRIVLLDDQQNMQLLDGSLNWLAELGVYQSYGQIVFSPDNQLLLHYSFKQNTAPLWNRNGELIAILSRHTSPIGVANFSPDSHRIITGDQEGDVNLWDTSGNFIASLEGHTQLVFEAIISADGNRIVTNGNDDSARLWDGDGHFLTLLTDPQGSDIYGIDMNPQGTRISGSRVTSFPDGSYISDGVTYLWDENGNLVKTLGEDTFNATWVEFNADGTRMLSPEGILFNEEGEQLASLESQKYDMSTVRSIFSPDGEYVTQAGCEQYDELSGTCSVSTVTLWDADGHFINTLEGHTDMIRDITFNHAGTNMATTASDGMVLVWDAQGRLLTSFRAHLEYGQETMFSAHDAHVISFGCDALDRSMAPHTCAASSVRQWDVQNSLLAVMNQSEGNLLSIDLDKNTGHIIAAASGGIATLWDENGRWLNDLTGHQADVNWAEFSPDGQFIVTASWDGTARLWDATGKLLHILAGHNDKILSAHFSPDGTRIVTASTDGTARIWDTVGNVLAVLVGHSDYVHTAVFNHDGTLILTGSADGTARLWDVEGHPQKVLSGHSSGVWFAAFNAGSTKIVTTSGDNTARLWDKNGNLIAILEGHDDQVTSAAFSPDGTRLVTVAWNGTGKLWDQEGRFLLDLEGHNERINSVRFNNTGTRILTTSDDGTVRLWNMSGNLLEVIDTDEAAVVGADFDAAGDILVTGSRNGTVRLWETRSDIGEMLTEAKMRLLPILDEATCHTYFDSDFCKRTEQ